MTATAPSLGTGKSPGTAWFRLLLVWDKPRCSNTASLADRNRLGLLTRPLSSARRSEETRTSERRATQLFLPDELQPATHVFRGRTVFPADAVNLQPAII